MAEQRYQAVLAVISDGETVTDVARRFGVSRQTVHAWLAKYEAAGLENLKDGSHRPRSCPHQMSGAVEVELALVRLGLIDPEARRPRHRRGGEEETSASPRRPTPPSGSRVTTSVTDQPKVFTAAPPRFVCTPQRRNPSRIADESAQG